MSTTVAAAVVRCEHCGRKNRLPAVADGAPKCGNCHQPLPWIVDASAQTFADVAERGALPVLVDMWAPWCAPCRMVSPALEQVARDLAGRVKLVKVDVDAAPALSQRFAVQAVPTLMVLRDGQVIARQSGAASAPAIRRWVQDAIGVRDSDT